MNSIEVIRCSQTGDFRYALIDFDGTLSLIREGWQRIMTPYFTELLCDTPKGKEMKYEEISGIASEFITLLTGKQTIYQCIRLAETIAEFGGKPSDPQSYKDEYVRRLMIHIDTRLKGLENGSVDPETLTVPGSYELLEMFRRHNVIPFLASGTDDEHVHHEASLLHVDCYFENRIYGAQRDYKTFSKKMVIERIIKENELPGASLLGFGDGYVEIENVREVGGFAVGVASDETKRVGIDLWKRERLIHAGANIIIPDYRDIEALENLLFECV